jgi:hypothetical protein
MITVESIANAILGNEGYNVYVRSPDSNLRVVAIEPEQFVELTLTMQAKWRLQCQ